MKIFKLYYELCRVTVSLFATCSAAVGFLVAPAPHAGNILFPVIGVFLLACGASALNQYQEQDIDGRMERTRRRPLPSGKITRVHALAVSITLLTSGLLIISRGCSKALILGLAAVLWYNGVYTRLKRITAFAAVPGALVGIAPPAIGWIAGGGGAHDPGLFALCAVMFIWQIPHFWLLILSRGDDYEKAGLPALTHVFSARQLARITFVWMLSLAIAGLALPLYGVAKSPVVSFAMVSAAVILTAQGARVLVSGTPAHAAPSAFRGINAYMSFLLLLVSLDPLLSGAVR